MRVNYSNSLSLADTAITADGCMTADSAAVVADEKIDGGIHFDTVYLISTKQLDKEDYQYEKKEDSLLTQIANLSRVSKLVIKFHESRLVNILKKLANKFKEKSKVQFLSVRLVCDTLPGIGKVNSIINVLSAEISYRLKYLQIIFLHNNSPVIPNIFGIYCAQNQRVDMFKNLICLAENVDAPSVVNVLKNDSGFDSSIILHPYVESIGDESDQVDLARGAGFLYPSHSLSIRQLALISEFNKRIDGFQANRSSVVASINKFLVSDLSNIVVGYLGYNPAERLVDDKKQEEFEQSFCSIS